MALRLRTEPDWEVFLTAANIPETAAHSYAKKLVENRFTETTLSELTAEHLQAIDIPVLGDILSILAHVKTTLSSPFPQPQVDSTTSTTTLFKPPPPPHSSFLPYHPT